MVRQPLTIAFWRKGVGADTAIAVETGSTVLWAVGGRANFVLGGDMNVGLSGERNSFGFGTVLDASAWVQTVYVLDGSFSKIYANGIALFGGLFPALGVPPADARLFVGADPYAGFEYWNGQFDDLRLYNRALSDSEVAALYASELPPPAAIVVPPASVTGLVGGTATLSVGATNALGYQWYKDGVALDGGTSTTLVLPNLRLSDGGSYWLVATTVMSRATSAPAVVVVHLPPAIVSQPLDTIVDAGGSVTLAASVASFPASVLQWFREGVPMPGATNATLVLGAVQAAGMGSYQLVASNVVGTISSRVARVSVTGADPAIWGGLIAYLPFNGGVADEGVWSHPVVQQGASLATDRRGKANAALALNGAGDFVEIPDHPAFATTNFTVALWFNPVRRAGASGGVDAEALFSKGPGSMDLQLGTPPSGTGGIRFRPRGEAAWDTTGPAFGTNRWQHVVAVYDASGGAVQVYVDGVARPMASTGVVVPSLTTTTNGLRLGLRHDGSGGFLGRLDDVRVYARALGASDVRALLASEAAAPVIVDPPLDVRRVEGSRVTVSAGLVGERPMAFAWSQAGATRVATGESLEFASLGRQDAGVYKLVVTNVHGTATSRAFTVDVLYGPELVFEPTDTSVNAGATVRLGAGVDGNPAPTLQWTRDGRALPGATNSTLTLAGIQMGDAGEYRLVASNEVGTVTGREVRVSVFYAPLITRQPRALTVDHGKGFEVSVEASGVPLPTFQWTRGGVALPGATNATVRVASATVGDEGEYRVEVRNELGTIQSDPALVTVRRVAPVIGGLPASLEVGEGDDMALAAAVEAIPSATLQWLHEGEPLPGETNATLKIARVRGVEAGRYALAATNVAGGAVREVVVGVKASWQSLGLALDTGLDVAWPWPTATGWQYQTTTSHDGEDAARSAKIGGYQSSEMRLPLRGPGSLTFWWRTSCEEGWDYAEVLLDGQRKGRMTGERNWAAMRVEVPEGLHTVTWRYAKDGSTDEGEDAAWVDEVTWTPETAGAQPAWVEVVPTLEGGYQVRSMGGGAGRAMIQSSADLETWRDLVVGTGTGGVLRARVEGTEGARFFRARTGNGN
ncbi:MAG: immunoglobulin domain-containing protein [Verrucomicrobiota bacterium]